MIDPAEDFELPQLVEQKLDAPHDDDEKEPFLHSVTSTTPWCLYSVMAHVLIIALIGMVSLMNEEVENQARTQLDADADPIQTTELFEPAAFNSPRDEPSIRMIGCIDEVIVDPKPYSFYKDSARRVAAVLRLVLHQFHYTK